VYTSLKNNRLLTAIQILLEQGANLIKIYTLQAKLYVFASEANAFFKKQQRLVTLKKLTACYKKTHKHSMKWPPTTKQNREIPKVCDHLKETCMLSSGSQEAP
jgi:hypothetical protein